VEDDQWQAATRRIASGIHELGLSDHAGNSRLLAAGGKGVVYYYAFAYGMRIDLKDAQLVAAPWARITSEGESTPRLEILEQEIKQIGVQGVRPLRKEEIKMFDQRAAIEEQIQTLSMKTSLHATDAKRLKEFFQLWCSTHGVIAEQLQPKHPEFFDWVGCK
jgi:hypothetical protein